MKKVLLLSIVIFLFLLNTVSAENILLLTNPRSHETDVFRKGSYIVVEFKKDGAMREGYIVDITDSSLVLDYSEVSLSQVNIFAGRTRSKIAAGKVAHAVGNTLLFTGSTVFNCGANIVLYNDYYYWPIGGTVWLAGACLAGLGYAFDWALTSPGGSMHVRNYRDWNARRITAGQPNTQKQISQPKDTVQPAPVEPKKDKKRKSKVAGDDVYGN